ncbi:MAG: PD40 domain-containing protein [Candidatus Eremiobacteraeota bacterium]|nr:PD40 domain-containing protein [Candidatus Eremiobacteraeota bacterium]
MRRRGFTLLEIMMVLLILSVFSVVAIQGLHRGKDKAGAQGLAFVISEEMRRVRQEAIARRRPTAFCLPTNGGTSPITRSFYVMDGEYQPRIVRSRNFKSEFAGANIFVGEWNLASGAWNASPLDVTGSKWSSFDFTNWVPSTSAARNDNCFVFLPDGTVRTNGIKSFDNRYHLLVSAGSTASGGRTGARLTGAGESFTISVSPVGGISLSSGILNENGSAGARGNYATTVNFSAPHPDTVALQDPDPLPGNPALFPKPNPANLPTTSPAPDALITKDQYVSLHMEAKSDSGEQLFCAWELQTPIPLDEDGNPSKGAFSLKGDSSSGAEGAGGRMEWDQNLRGGVGAWKTDWQWRPPIKALPGKVYTLQCKVQNVNGGNPRVEIKRFEIRPPGRILFQSNRANPGPGIYTMDESGQRERIYLPGFIEPSATVDGQRIVCVNATNGELILHTPLDPTNNLTLFSGQARLPSISPNGNLVAFYRDSGGVLSLCVMKVGQGASPIDIPGAPQPPAPLETVKLSWSDDGNTLYYPDGTNLAALVLPLMPGGQPNVHAGATHPITSSGAGQISSSTTLNGALIVTDNYSPYDPWITHGGGSRLYLSVGDEDASVERNPRGGQFMVTHRALTDPYRQLHIVTYPGARGGPLTSQGSNFHPVWTK